MPNYNISPKVQQLLDQIRGGGFNKGLERRQRLAAGDQDAFAELEAPQRREFTSQIGQLGSRFAGTGGLGSSAFQNATGTAASNFSQDLGAQRFKIQEDSLDSLLGLYERLLSHETVTPESNILGDILGGAAGGAAQGFAAGGPAGGAAGALGGGILGAFSGGNEKPKRGGTISGLSRQTELPTWDQLYSQNRWRR